MVDLINVDAYLFWLNSGIGVSGRTLPLDSKEAKLGSGNQDSSPSVGKNTSLNLVPCHA